MAAVSPCLQRGRNTLNPDSIKKEYLKQLSDFVHLHNNSELDCYQITIDDLMEQVKEVKKLKEHGVALNPDQQLLDDSYYVIEDCNQKVQYVLVKKILEDNIVTSTQRVLTKDNCLEFFLKEHKQIGYRIDTSSLVETLNANFMYPKICLDIYLKSCDICSIQEEIITINKPEIIKQQIFNKIGQLQVNNIATNNTQIFQYILIYVDKLTNFTILRPLMIDTVEEISTELLKIFLEFGPPETLHIYETGKYTFYSDVFKRIKVIMPVFDIKWTLETSSFSNFFTTVMDELAKWTKKSGSSNWEIGCYIVQWKMNSTKPISPDEDIDNNGVENKNPYEIVFAEPLNSAIDDKSKSSQSVRTTTPKQVRPSIAHSSKQATSNSFSTEVLPKLDPKNFAFSIEIMSDESEDSE